MIKDEELERIRQDSTVFVDRLKDKVHFQEMEIERLNNIINELDTFLYDRIEHDKSSWGQVYSIAYKKCKDKLQELKENK